MLNVNAKAFVPPGADSFAPAYTENEYRYRIDVSPQRAIDASTNARTINSVSTLLTSKSLFADRGTRDMESLRYFLSQTFLSAANLPTSAMAGEVNSGFLLSKSILALYVDIASTNALNNAPGFLIRLDVPREFGAEVVMSISGAWELLYNRFSKDARVSAFGYSRSLTGLNNTRIGGSYRHYLYVACDEQSGLGIVSPDDFADLQIPIGRITKVSSITPYVCGTRCPLSVFITVGNEAKKTAFPENAPADFFFQLEHSSEDRPRTYDSFEAFETYFLSVLAEGHKWEKTSFMNLHINVSGKNGSGTHQPIWETIFLVGRLCDDTGALVGGISFSSKECAPGSERILALNDRGPFYVNATVDEMCKKQFSLDTTNSHFGDVPLHLCREMSRSAVVSAARAVSQYFSIATKRLSDVQQLTRMNFADAADLFAKHRFWAKRKVVGTPLLLGTDSEGSVFGVDLHSGGIFSLRKIFEGRSGLLRDCLFTGTLTSVNQGSFEYHIIIDDILSFQNTDVRRLPFTERWKYVEKMDIGEEESWPHATVSHVVILRAGYVPYEKTEELVKLIPTNFATCGIDFVDESPSATSGPERYHFAWVHPASLTVRFAVHKVQRAPEDNDELIRLFLAVAEEGKNSRGYVSFEGEYVDVPADAYEDLQAGSVVECLLRRAEDGAHWWDVVRDYKPGTVGVPTYTHVDKLVHSLGITLQEMLWLPTSPSFQCQRCKKVSDAGWINSTKKVYWCKACWRETGHGDCAYCHCPCAAGMHDSESKLFYCSNCWTNFSTPNSQAEIGYHVPPPPNATFTQQVSTRCVSLLIDYLNPKGPSNDVLDLCCGGSVVRKWMRNKTMRYVGIDLKSSVVDSINDLIAKSDTELPSGARYEAVCADVFSGDFWTHTITKIHPQQFHAVTCFVGLHHVFRDEEHCRRFVARIANALVPGGVFIGFSTDASLFHNKGTSFENSVVKVQWEDDAVPRIGHRFHITIEEGRLREENVVPIDFLIAVALEYGLEVISEACTTFRELIERDATWTKVPSADEKEYLCALRTFAFKKIGSELAPTEAGH